ncbi:spermatogenesis- and oogenesis-specific basic helix-loop-helix-containing protein 2 [Pteronotus mesoamericanus]|uniref:spermatogenesis- and oogenesis-specific basic helix-loop-helix-containing protein 2 n=1 Tax=Pteronotus mesoamericanus TaxID=1884717 RepID=UPI0023EC5584|nr:spermatogenesis- and oogenesis-specific basic helix-loop-helix-containing protein 2 [Pteronotus parnellii mesoamericanus]
MAASISGREPDRVAGQVKIDVLLLGDVPVQPLADAVQKLFSNLAEVTVTVGDVPGAAALLAEHAFHLVFLRPACAAAGDLAAPGSLRFGKKKNTHFLFVFIIPENFKGCISGHGADITITEPLTMEKLSVVVKYWETYFSTTVKRENPVTAGEPRPPPREPCTEGLGCFSADLFACSDSLRNDIGLELKAPLSDFERSKRISLLHSSKEKLRRERIKHSCEQLRALVPGGKGRKNDAASVLEAAVEHVQRVRDRIPPAVLGQIAEALQRNARFCKKQAPFQLPLPSAAATPRENSVSASVHPPGRGISFLANRCLSLCPAPASGGPSDGAVRGPPSSAPETAAGHRHQGCAPSPALPLSSSHAIRYCPTVVPCWGAAAGTSHSVWGSLPSPGPGAPKGLPPHCSSAQGQARTTRPDCLVSLRGSWTCPGSVPPTSKAPDVRVAANALVRNPVGVGPGAVSPGLQPAFPAVVSRCPEPVSLDAAQLVGASRGLSSRVPGTEHEAAKTPLEAVWCPEEDVRSEPGRTLAPSCCGIRTPLPEGGL